RPGPGRRHPVRFGPVSRRLGGEGAGNGVRPRKRTATPLPRRPRPAPPHRRPGSPLNIYEQPTDPAKRRSAALTDGVDRAPARAMLKGVGFSDEDLAKPL